MELGPVQFIAFAFDSVDKFEGQIRHELNDLRERGLMRIIDLLFILKDDDGTLNVLQHSDLNQSEAVEFGAVLGPMLGMGAGGAQGAYLGELLGALTVADQAHGVSITDIQAAAAEIPPGKAAALLLFEHSWATDFAAAIRSADGRMVAQGFLTRDALLAVGAEMQATVEAEMAIERAEAIKGAAMLDALRTVIEAEVVKQVALEEAADTVAATELIKTAAAAEAVHALITAGFIETAAAEYAVNALVAADLIAASALVDASQAAERALTDAS